jgi:CTP synthase
MPTADTIYEVPLILEASGLGAYVDRHLGLGNATPNLDEWRTLVERIKSPHRSIRVALIGKYVDLHDSYMSIAESLTHAGLAHDVNVEIDWVNSETVTAEELDKILRRVSGVLVGPGFGPRGTEGKVLAARIARERGLPYFGICYGLHMAVIEAARNLCGFDGANSSEIDPESPHPVIDLMPGQHGVEMGGTMRLGLWPCRLEPDTIAAEAYREPTVHERHRHRFEVNNEYRQALAEAGFIASGISPDGQLVEIMERRDHPFFVGVQFHPEFRSRPTRPHPLFREFIGAAVRTLPEGAQRALPLNGATVALTGAPNPALVGSAD